VQRWSALPVAGYSTETAVFAGAMAVHYPLPRPGARGSAVPLIAIASVKRQCQLALAPDLYAAANAWHLQANLSARRWPADFYLPGNDPPPGSWRYQTDGLEMELIVQRRFGAHAFCGPVLRCWWTDIDWRSGPSPPGLRGAGGGLLTSTGFAATWDTRDNARAPRTGTLLAAGASLAERWLGSDFDFVEALAQARRFVPCGRRQTLALAADLRLIGGQAPFSAWSTPDGVMQLRGIEAGRFRDRHLCSVQAEIRRSLGLRHGLVAFVDAAQVAPSLGTLSPGRFHWAAGAGGRYALNPEQRLNLRLDAGWVNGGIGWVFRAGEAF